MYRGRRGVLYVSKLLMRVTSVPTFSFTNNALTLAIRYAYRMLETVTYIYQLIVAVPGSNVTMYIYRINHFSFMFLS